MYCRGLGLQEIGRFENHDGFDGVMLGTQGWVTISNSPTAERTRCCLHRHLMT